MVVSIACKMSGLEWFYDVACGTYTNLDVQNMIRC